MANPPQKQVLKADVGLSPEQFQAIGTIAAYWSLLEYHVGLAIGDLLGVGIKQARVLTTQMQLRPKLQILQLLAELKGWPQTDQDELKKATKRIEEASDLRNQFIHGVWARDSSGKFYIVWHRGTARNRILGQAIPAEITDLKAAALEIAGIAEGFILWWTTQKARLSASP